MIQMSPDKTCLTNIKKHFQLLKILHKHTICECWSDVCSVMAHIAQLYTLVELWESGISSQQYIKYLVYITRPLIISQHTGSRIMIRFDDKRWLAKKGSKLLFGILWKIVIIICLNQKNVSFIPRLGVDILLITFYLS